MILTLTADPVLAKVRNCTRSGIISGNISKVHGDPCGGCTPGYWKNHPNQWPDGYDESSTWDDTFCPNEDYFPHDYTLVEVLDNVLKFPASPVEQFAFHSVAALFNRLADVQGLKDITFGYTETQIRNMVCNAYGTGNEALMEQYKDLFEFANEYDNSQC